MLTQREILCNVGDSVRVKATGKIGQITKSNGHAHKVNGVRLHEAETELDRARADSRTPKLAGTLEVSQAQIEVIQKGIAAELRKIFELPAHTPEEAYGIPLKLTPSPRVRRSKQRKRGKGEARLDEALSLRKHDSAWARQTALQTQVCGTQSQLELADSKAIKAKIAASSKELLQELRIGDQQSAIERFVSMAFDGEPSSRAAQLALENASCRELSAFSRGLHEQVWKATKSKNANHVVTKIVQLMHPNGSSFIADKLLEEERNGVKVACHKYGCRVVCALLDRMPAEVASLSAAEACTVNLIDQVLQGAEELCKHRYGHIVVGRILQRGSPGHQLRIAEILRQSAISYSADRYGSLVMESFLRWSSREDCKLITQEMLAIGQKEMLELATGRFSRHVVVTILGMEFDIRQLALGALGTPQMEKQISASKYGGKVSSEVARLRDNITQETQNCALA